MSENNTFKLDTSDFLGLKYNEYKNKMYALAISKPSDFFSLREKVLDEVKTKAIGNLYETIYSILSDGKINGQSIATTNNSVSVTLPKPSYPKQNINNLSLSAAQTLDQILEQVVEILLPLDYKSLASARLEEKGRANVQ